MNKIYTIESAFEADFCYLTLQSSRRSQAWWLSLEKSPVWQKDAILASIPVENYLSAVEKIELVCGKVVKSVGKILVKDKICKK